MEGAGNSETDRLPPPADWLSVPTIDPLLAVTVTKVAAAVYGNSASARFFGAAVPLNSCNPTTSSRVLDDTTLHREEASTDETHPRPGNMPYHDRLKLSHSQQTQSMWLPRTTEGAMQAPPHVSTR
jgi:hypothetical protein